MSIYGIYKNVRDSAWQCLIDYNIKPLPVDPLSITTAAGIKVVKNSEVNELSGGACVFRDNKWYIVYDDESSVGRRRFIVTHELGHILLGHEMETHRHEHTFNVNKPQSEKEADMFAARLLAPACVLWGLNLRTPEDIARVCNISKAAAVIRAERMAVLYARQKFLTSPLEHKVFEQFKEFIEDTNTKHLR